MDTSSTSHSPLDPFHRQRQAYRFVIGLFGLALLVATWKLWTPQTIFPRVPLVYSLPLVGPLGKLPPWIDWFALCLIALGLCSLLWPDRAYGTSITGSGRWSQAKRFLGLAVPSGFFLSVLLDQHRLQPWAYQISALSLLFVYLPSVATLRLARLLTIGIYGWSALGKIDFQFAHTVGAELVSTLLGLFRIDTSQLTHQQLATAALLLPLGELIVATLLSFQRSRRWGVVAAILMHLTLMLALGPLGLGHEPGVLLWNGLFICQAAILFWPNKKNPQSLAPTTAADSSGFLTWPARQRTLLGTSLVLLMLALPIGERLGRWDHWLSWALYAPHSSRVQLWIAPQAIDRLPHDLQVLMQDAPTNQWGWQAVPLGLWSLSTLGAPIYPQQRFQLGVAIALVEQAELDHQFSLELRDVSQRRTGERDVTQLNRLQALHQAVTRYRFNAVPQ